MATPPHTRGSHSQRRMEHRLETWLWTGPAGHLLGGVLDFMQALWRYQRLRVRRARGSANRHG